MTLFAMTILAALSMLESGDNDRAIGNAGEVSRYQVMPDVWRLHHGKDPTNPVEAKRVATQILMHRIASFQVMRHRTPTPFETYLLWRCPGRVSNPTKRAAETAERFANLVQAKP